jgi:hypothetical protein
VELPGIDPAFIQRERYLVPVLVDGGECVLEAPDAGVELGGVLVARLILLVEVLDLVDQLLLLESDQLRAALEAKFAANSHVNTWSFVNFGILIGAQTAAVRGNKLCSTSQPESYRWVRLIQSENQAAKPVP